MSGLTIKELNKRAGRVETFIDMWANGSAFLFDDGQARKIITLGSKQKQLSVKALSKNKKERDIQIGQAIAFLKSTKETLTILTEDGKEFSFGKLVKTKEFGGTGKAEGTTAAKISGGTITEVLSENGFCFYYALLVNDKLEDFKPESFKTVTDKRTYVELIKKLGLEKQLFDSLNDTQIQKYIPLMYPFLLTGFHDILKAQVKKFKKDFSKVEIGRAHV